MAQGDYREDELFSTDVTDVEDLDNSFSLSDITTEGIAPATDEDRKQEHKPVEKPKQKETKQEVTEEPVKSAMEEDGEETPEEAKEDESHDALSEYEEIAKGFFKLGLWSRDEDEDDNSFPSSEEEFVERTAYEDRKRASSYVDQLANKHGEEARELFDAVYLHGVPVREFVTKWQESQDFKAMDLTDEGNQEKVVRTAYEQQGIPADKIADKIRKLKQSEDLEDEANTWHTALVKKQEAQLQRTQEESANRLEQKKQADIHYSTAIRNILSEKAKSQDFDGIPVNTKTAEKARDFLETKKWRLKDGTLITDFDRVVMELKNPNNFETLTKLGLLLDFEPGKPVKLNLDSVSKRKETKQVQEKFFNIGKPKTKQPPVSAKITESTNLLDDL